MSLLQGNAPHACRFDRRNRLPEPGTANHWLAGMDRAKAQILPWLEVTYGPRDSLLWFRRWRMFYMAVAELFGYACGKE